MGQITLIKRNGEKINLFTKEPFCTVTNAVQNVTLMGDDNVQLAIKSTQFIDFDKGDKILVDGQEYSIRTKVNREILADGIYSYDPVFYGVMYELMKSQYRNCDASGKSTKSTFDLTYSLCDFIKVVIYNVNRDYPGIWKFDEDNCPETEPKTFQFSKQNCLQVIQTVCKEFKYEFRIDQENGVRIIRVGKFGAKVIPPGGNDFFEWGKGNGLYKLKEQKVDDKSIITRLWIEGGTQNIRSEYRDYSERLQLPYPKRLNQREHTLSDGTVIEAKSEYIGIDDDSKRYIEDPELRDLIGSDEDTEYYEDIYPQRTGTVTALGSDIYSFVDNTMDFDLSEKDSEGTKYLISGVSAKINFISGKLAGQQFELKEKGGYTHATKTFSIIKQSDQRGLEIPTPDSDAFRIEVGDKYKITDINLPKSYEDNAEEDLWYAGYDDFKDRKQVRAQYVLTFDRPYFLNNLPSDVEMSVFQCGDYVPVKDERYRLEKNIRIQKMSRNLLADHDYTLTLSDTTTVSIQTQTVLDVLEHNIIIDNNRLRDLNKARRGWRTTEELRNMVYDTDGYFDSDNIRPNSIDTNMLTVGSKSQQFILIDTVLQANVNGLPNRFEATAGILAHLSLDDTEIRKWNIAAASVTLSESGGYYVFARCSKNGSSGTYHITQEQLKVEPVSDPNNYYFQVGIIGSLRSDDNFRDFVTTYGFTRINGNTITTGKIVTSDGECYLDLDGNKFRIGDAANSIDWNVTAKNQLTLRNVRLLSDSGDLSHIGVYRGVYNSIYTYYKGDEVSYTANGETCTYRYTNDSPSKGNLPTNSVYWAIVAQGKKGDPGEQGIPGKDGDGRTSYFHIKYSAVANPTTSSQLSETPNTYIGTYVDYVAEDSTDPKKYTWARFQGADGNDGIPGKNGENGETTYLHIKYSNDGGLTFTDNNGETPGSWMGQYTDFKPLDSDVITDYTWSQIKGDPGTPGTSGIDGVDGDFYEYRYAKNKSETTAPTLDKNSDSPAGWSTTMPTVSSGEYLWCTISKKSKVLNTTLMYLPVLDTDKTTLADASGNGKTATFSSSNVSVVKDSSRGEVLKFNGVGNCIAPLELPFDSDFTMCLWLKPVASKIGWMVNCTNGREYVENYIDVTANKWVHFAFRKNDKTITVFKDGVEISRNSTNNDHVGFSVYDDNMFGTFAEMDEIRLFKSALSAEQIVTVKNGTVTSMIEKWTTPVRVNGSDGDYFEYRYAKNGSTTAAPSLTATAAAPSGWTTTMPTLGTLEYLWCTVAKKSAVGTLLQNWSTPVRIKGADGAKGDKGDKGENPVLVYRGVYSSTKTYYGNTKRLDAVQYNGQYYIARIDGGTMVGKAPTNTTYWNTFGAEFETIATNLLLAEGANIGNWFMSGGKIVSTLSGSNKITLDASMAQILIQSTYSGGDYSQSTSMGSKITLSASTGTIETRATSNTSRVAYMSPTGIFCNNAETQAVSSVTGITRKAAIVGLGYGNVDKYDWGNENFLAGVYGIASNSGTAPGYGGYFRDLFVAGLILHRQAYDNTNDATYYLPNYASMVIGYSSKRTTVYLPGDGVMGKTIFFKQWWTGSIRIRARSGQSLWDDHTKNDYFDIGEGYGAILTFTIGYIGGVKTEAWLFNRYKW